jgi:predicted  nucleic acid-binding Zn-ribbon protein
MASVDPKEALKALLDLQRIDHDVWRIRQRIREMPQILERRGERFRQAGARVAAAAARVTDLRKQIGLCELEVKTKEGEVAKIQGAQGQSRTNEEFRAFGDHVQRLKKEIRAVEDRILEFLGAIESVEKEMVDLKATREALKQEVDADRAQWQKDEAEYRGDLARRESERAARAATIAPGPLSVYDRVLKVREGKAMVPADGRVCGGCSMSVTANDYNKLLAGGQLISCRSCERILYISENAAAGR